MQQQNGVERIRSFSAAPERGDGWKHAAEEPERLYLEPAEFRIWCARVVSDSSKTAA
jgi:hypothetical protein